MVSGANGAVSVACRPMAQLGLAATAHQAVDLRAIDGCADRHDRRGVEPLLFDQFTNGAIDAGAHAVIVGAEPDAAQYTHVIQPWSGEVLVGSSRGLGRLYAMLGNEVDRPRLDLGEFFPMYSPTTPIMINWTPPMVIKPTTSEG